MLPPGKKIEECEGECLVETGKNINADYIAQARVGRFGNQLMLTVGRRKIFKQQGTLNYIGLLQGLSIHFPQVKWIFCSLHSRLI